MSTRLDPRTGIVTIDNVFGHGLNPSFPDYLGAKVGFDATRAVPHRYEHERAFYKKVALDQHDIVVPEIKPATERVPATPTGDKSGATGGAAM
jgi:2,5-furandicarboxylate decarboxylase 1